MPLTKVGSFAANTGTGNQSVTGVGFQGKTGIFWATAQTADGLANGLRFSMGFGISSSSRACITGASEDAQAAAACRASYATSKILQVIANDGTELVSLDFVSWGADGFTVNVAATSGTAVIINYLILGGSDLTNVAIKSVSTPTASGSQAETGVGFQPDCIIPLTVALLSTRMVFGLGFGTGSSAQACLGVGSVSTADPSVTNRYQRTDKIVGVPYNDAMFLEANLTSLDADGFTQNWTTVDASARNEFVLCLKGGQYKVFNDTQKTSTGIKTTSGLGFIPVGELICCFNNGVSSSVVAHASASFGAAGPVGNNTCIWFTDEDAQTTTDTYSSLTQTKVIQANVVSTGALSAECELSAFRLNEIDHDWTTANATSRQFIGLAFGIAPQTITVSATATGTGSAVAPAVTPGSLSILSGTATATDSALAPTVTATLSIPVGTLQDSLQAFWKLADANEAWGANHLTNNGGVTFVSGKIGNAANFVAASSQYLSIIDNAALSMGDIDFQIACWVRLTTKPAAQCGLVGKWGTITEYLLYWDNAADRFTFIVRDAADAATVSVVANTLGTPSIDTWYYLEAKHDASANIIGIAANCGTFDITSHSGGVLNSTEAFRLGVHGAGLGARLNGDLDAVGIWKRILTARERTYLYNGGTGWESLDDGVVSSTSSTVAPTLTAGAIAQSVTDAAVATGSAVPPTMAPATISLVPDVILATCTVTDPTLAAIAVLTTDAIVASASASAPSVTVGDPQPVPGVAIGTGVIVSPTATPGAITVSIIDVTLGTSSAVAPTLSPGSLSPSVPAVTGSASAIAPALTAIKTIAIDVISSAAAAVAPSMSSGAISVSPEVAAATGSVIAPAVTAGDPSPDAGVALCTAAAVAPAPLGGAITITVNGTALATVTAIGPSLVATISLMPGFALATCTAIEPDAFISRFLSTRFGIVGGNGSRRAMIGEDGRRLPIKGSAGQRRTLKGFRA